MAEFDDEVPTLISLMGTEAGVDFFFFAARVGVVERLVSDDLRERFAAAAGSSSS